MKNNKKEGVHTTEWWWWWVGGGREEGEVVQNQENLEFGCENWVK